MRVSCWSAFSAIDDSPGYHHSNAFSAFLPLRFAPRKQLGALLGLRELMGHSTTRVALIYQHRTTERDRAIAATIGQLAETELSQRRGASGTDSPRGSVTFHGSDQRTHVGPGIPGVERVTGIEPALSAWEADVLPLNYTRTGHPRTGCAYHANAPLG